MYGNTGLNPSLQSDYSIEARQFFAIAGITNPLHKKYIDFIVKNYKRFGLWEKALAIYPIAGGNAVSHSFNLKDPSSFRMTFSGGITHSETGMAGNGTNGWYDTNLNDNTHMILNNASTWVYLRTDQAIDNAYDISSNTSILDVTYINSRNASNLFSTLAQNSLSNAIANTESKGLFGVSRTTVGSYKKYKNKVETNVPGATSTAKANNNFRGMGGGGSFVYNTREQSFLSIGRGLTTQEAFDQYEIIQAAQTILNRQV